MKYELDPESGYTAKEVFRNENAEMQEGWFIDIVKESRIKAVLN